MNNTPSADNIARLVDLKVSGVGYLSGPMRGMPNNNYDTFNAVAAAYRTEGFTVFNPAESFDGDQSLSQYRYLRLDLMTVLGDVDYLIVLPGWEDSVGALLEVAVAQAIGLPVFDNNTRSPLLFTGLVAGFGHLAVSPVAQSWSSSLDDYEDQDEEEDGDYADRDEPEEEDSCGGCDDSSQSAYNTGYEAGVEAGMLWARDERDAMADLVEVQTERIDNLKDPGVLERLRGEIVSVLDEAYYSLPESLDERDSVRLAGYMDHDQLVKNDDTCRHILELLGELDEDSDETDAPPAWKDEYAPPAVTLGSIMFDVNPVVVPVGSFTPRPDSALWGEGVAGSDRRFALRDPGRQNDAGGSVLDEANALINGDRQATYGHPGRDFGDTAALWSVYLGTVVHAHDVAAMMIMLKLSRHKNGYKRDTAIDIAGYAGCMEKVQEWVDDGSLPSYRAPSKDER